MGKLQAECFGKSLNGQGSVAVMAGPAGQSWADERAKGFQETIAKEFSNIKILTEDRNAVDRATGLSTMQAWIARYPELSGVNTAYDDIGAGAVDAIKAAAKSGQIKVSSSNLSQIGEQMLKSDDLVAKPRSRSCCKGPRL